jgi:beta-phosphoglucomutase-like phosphatase (HAD superfamily)
VWSWRKSDPEFAKAWDQAIDDALYRIEAELMTRHCVADPKTALRLLRQRWPDRYGDKQEKQDRDLKFEIFVEKPPQETPKDNPQEPKSDPPPPEDPSK